MDNSSSSSHSGSDNEKNAQWPGYASQDSMQRPASGYQASHSHQPQTQNRPQHISEVSQSLHRHNQAPALRELYSSQLDDNQTIDPALLSHSSNNQTPQSQPSYNVGSSGAGSSGSSYTSASQYSAINLQSQVNQMQHASYGYPSSVRDYTGNRSMDGSMYQVMGQSQPQQLPYSYSTRSYSGHHDATRGFSQEILQSQSQPRQPLYSHPSAGSGEHHIAMGSICPGIGSQQVPQTLYGYPLPAISAHNSAFTSMSQSLRQEYPRQVTYGTSTSSFGVHDVPAGTISQTMGLHPQHVPYGNGTSFLASNGYNNSARRIDQPSGPTQYSSSSLTRSAAVSSNGSSRASSGAIETQKTHPKSKPKADKPYPPPPAVRISYRRNAVGGGRRAVVIEAPPRNDFAQIGPHQKHPRPIYETSVKEEAIRFWSSHPFKSFKHLQTGTCANDEEGMRWLRTQTDDMKLVADKFFGCYVYKWPNEEGIAKVSRYRCEIDRSWKDTMLGQRREDSLLQSSADASSQSATISDPTLVPPTYESANTLVPELPSREQVNAFLSKDPVLAFYNSKHSTRTSLKLREAAEQAVAWLHAQPNSTKHEFESYWKEHWNALGAERVHYFRKQCQERVDKASAVAGPSNDESVWREGLILEEAANSRPGGNKSAGVVRNDHSIITPEQQSQNMISLAEARDTVPRINTAVDPRKESIVGDRESRSRDSTRKNGLEASNDKTQALRRPQPLRPLKRGLVQALHHDRPNETAINQEEKQSSQRKRVRFDIPHPKATSPTPTTPTTRGVQASPSSKSVFSLVDKDASAPDTTSQPQSKAALQDALGSKETTVYPPIAPVKVRESTDHPIYMLWRQHHPNEVPPVLWDEAMKTASAWFLNDISREMRARLFTTGAPLCTEKGIEELFRYSDHCLRLYDEKWWET